MSNDKMQAARELIKAKRYSEARAILKTVDHPRAREWLAKLDEIDPFGDLEETPQRGKTGEKAKRRRSPLWLVGMAFACLVIAYLASGGSQGLEERQAAATAQDVAQQSTSNAEASIIALTPPTATSTITDTPIPSVTPSLAQLQFLRLQQCQRWVHGVIHIHLVNRELYAMDVSA